MFQEPSLDDELTPFENMELHGVRYKVPSLDRRAKIEKLFRFVELWDRNDRRVMEFSGGLKRRLEIARALLHEPRVLLLDEPTAGLDPQTRNHIWSFIRTLSRDNKVTVFFTTHYTEEAERVADEVAVIGYGKIVAADAPRVLKDMTQKDTLEEAFIALTGIALRDEASSPTENLLPGRLAWDKQR